MKRRVAGVLAAVALAAAAGSAGAHGGSVVDDGALDRADETHLHGQHGGEEGHLPASSENVRLVGRANINQDGKDGRVADVGVFGNYAYLGAYWEPNCQKGGVYVFDIRNPAAPRQINFIRTSNDSYVGEGVQVVRIDTPQYTGDVLAMNNEMCGKETQVGANGGMTLVDVTDPKRHRYLVEHAGDEGEVVDGVVNSIHSVFLWDAGDRAYAVQVDNEESTDVDIFDISDPRNPVQVGDYDLAASFPQILQENVGLDSVFLHDVIVEEVGGRQVMVASYWDGGYVLLDVTDPANATYIGDTDFTFPDPEAAESGLTVDPEGNAHQAEFTSDDEYLIAADEDFDPYKAQLSTDDGSEFTAIPGSDVPGVPTGGTIEGQAVFLGLACGAVPPAGGPDRIAVVERGVCDFQVKYDNVVAAGGYEAMIVFNRENGPAGDGCETYINMLVSGETLPAFFVTREDGFGFFDTPYDDAACQAGDGTAQAPIAAGALGDVITMTSTFDGWGYVHLYENGAGKLAELDTYAIPEAHDPAYAEGSGDLSVHEVAVSAQDAGLAYLSYYAAGFRVLRVVGGELQEVGHFIDEGGNNFWGVEVFERGGVEYVAASDRDYGLYIFEYTGP